MKMRPTLILLALLAPGGAMAAQLWCMPDTICRTGGACHATTDTETSVRLNDKDSATPSLRTHAEDVALTRTHNGASVQWQGVSADGADEILAWRPADGSFVYLIRSQGREVRATGRCDIQ